MVIDIVFAVFALYGFYLGFSKGIIETFFSFLSVMFGAMAAFKFAPQVTEILQTTFSSNNPLMFIAGFVVTFAGTMIVIRMIAKGLEGILKTANINVINQIFGGALLSGVMILVCSVGVWFAEKSHVLDNSTKQESLTYPYLEPFPAIVWNFGNKLKPAFAEFWDHSLDVMDRIEDMSVKREESNPSVYDIPDDDDRAKRPNENKPRRRKIN